MNQQSECIATFALSINMDDQRLASEWHFVGMILIHIVTFIGVLFTQLPLVEACTMKTTSPFIDGTKVPLSKFDLRSNMATKALQGLTNSLRYADRNSTLEIIKIMHPSWMAVHLNMLTYYLKLNTTWIVDPSRCPCIGENPCRRKLIYQGIVVTYYDPSTGNFIAHDHDSLSSEACGRPPKGNCGCMFKNRVQSVNDRNTVLMSTTSLDTIIKEAVLKRLEDLNHGYTFDIVQTRLDHAVLNSGYKARGTLVIQPQPNPNLEPCQRICAKGPCMEQRIVKVNLMMPPWGTKWYHVSVNITSVT